MGTETTWGATHAAILGQGPVAYFSAEFGLHESLPIYSGGLGVLAGDHLKSASDLGLPLVGVGLFYHDRRLFYSSVDAAGGSRSPIRGLKQFRCPYGSEERIRPRHYFDLRCAPIESTLACCIWPLGASIFTCSTRTSHRTVRKIKPTARLYGGDQRTRIRQELLLGVGGVKALRALEILPNVIHMNEGHSAFAPLEVIRQRMQEDGLSFECAMRDTARRCTFTTHTPVPAGHDRFDEQLIEEHLGPWRRPWTESSGAHGAGTC